MLYTVRLILCYLVWRSAAVGNVLVSSVEVERLILGSDSNIFIFVLVFFLSIALANTIICHRHTVVVVVVLF